MPVLGLFYIINKMCRLTRLLLAILCLSLTGIAWAKDSVVIIVNGLSGAIQKNVTQALENQRTEIIKPINIDGVQAFYQQNAPRAIREAMQPYGYFHPKFTSNLTRRGNQWTATFNITSLGPPIRIRDVNIDILGPGKNDHNFLHFFKHVPIKIGDILHTEKYETTKQLLYDIASTRGFFDAKMLESKIFIDIKNNTAKILIRFETGQRYLFGSTTFSDSPFSPRFLMRFLRYKKGKNYNYHHVEQTQKDFINSNYFSQAVVNAETKKRKNGSVPMHIKIVPRKRYAYTLGAGYGTDTGPRGTLGFSMRRVNRYGHQIKTLIQAAKNNSYADASYFIPGRHPASDVWTFTAGYANFDQITGNGKSYKLQAGYSTSLGKRWSQTVALTYLDERYNIITFPFTKSNVLYPNITWQYFSTQNQVNPKNGLSFSGFLGGTPKLGLSDTSFFQIRLNTKFLFTLFDTTRFIFRGVLAHTNIKDLKALPFSLQLFAGGARSIRGYSYNQLGPGRNLFIGSFELQQRVYGDWYLCGFIDSGNVTSNSPFKNLNLGVGPGIAWLSPIGVLEVTVANAITQPNKPWVIQFTMGPEL